MASVASPLIANGSIQQENNSSHTKAPQTLSHGFSNGTTSSNTLNLFKVTLVLKPDVKEPPTFRGDHTDKYTVYEWIEVAEPGHTVNIKILDALIKQGTTFY